MASKSVLDDIDAEQEATQRRIAEIRARIEAKRAEVQAQQVSV